MTNMMMMMIMTTAISLYKTVSSTFRVTFNHVIEWFSIECRKTKTKASANHFRHGSENGYIEWFSIECRKTKTKPITYQLDYSNNLKP